MVFLKYAVLTAMVACVIAVVVTAVKSGDFFKTIFKSAFFGVCSLLGVSAVSLFGIDTLAVNAYTIACSALCGIPGTLLMLLTETAWGI